MDEEHPLHQVKQEKAQAAIEGLLKLVNPICKLKSKANPVFSDFCLDIGQLFNIIIAAENKVYSNWQTCIRVLQHSPESRWKQQTNILPSERHKNISIFLLLQSSQSTAETKRALQN